MFQNQEYCSLLLLGSHGPSPHIISKKEAMQNTLQDAKQRREDLGVQLFGFQQQLRGIFEAMDQGVERDKRLADIRSVTTAKVLDMESALKTLEHRIRDQNHQV